MVYILDNGIYLLLIICLVFFWIKLKSVYNMMCIYLVIRMFIEYVIVCDI